MLAPLLFPVVLGGSWSFGDYGKMVFSTGTAGSGPSYTFAYGNPRRRISDVRSHPTHLIIISDSCHPIPPVGDTVLRSSPGSLENCTGVAGSNGTDPQLGPHQGVTLGFGDAGSLEIQCVKLKLKTCHLVTLSSRRGQALLVTLSPCPHCVGWRKLIEHTPPMAS